MLRAIIGHVFAVIADAAGDAAERFLPEDDDAPVTYWRRAFFLSLRRRCPHCKDMVRFGWPIGVEARSNHTIAVGSSFDSMEEAKAWAGNMNVVEVQGEAVRAKVDEEEEAFPGTAWED